MEKRVWLLLTVIIIIALMFWGCAPEPAVQADWSIAVQGADKAEFTSGDYAKLHSVTIDTVLKTKDGTETSEQWEGVLLRDVLNSLGVTEYTSITLEASDGYAKDYTPDIVNDAQTILGVVVNGKALTQEDGFVCAVPAGQPGNMRVKSLIKITVHE